MIAKLPSLDPSFDIKPLVEFGYNLRLDSKEEKSRHTVSCRVDSPGMQVLLYVYSWCDDCHWIISSDQLSCHAHVQRLRRAFRLE